jgi:hypothetical protein
MIIIVLYVSKKKKQLYFHIPRPLTESADTKSTVLGTRSMQKTNKYSPKLFVHCRGKGISKTLPDTTTFFLLLPFSRNGNHLKKGKCPLMI